MLPSEKIQPDTSKSPSSDRTVPYVIALLLLPALVLCWRDDPLYSPLWQSDPWFYLGYFRNLVNFKRSLFPDFYYGSRLSWILPGYLLHSLFPPLVANAVLHLTVHSVAVLSLFSILRLTVGLRSAYLTAMVFSFHPWLWSATGWDHVTGAAIAYYLLAMALATHAALQPVRKFSLILAGMALAGAVYAHLFLVAFAPLLLFYYIGLKGEWDRRHFIRSISDLAIWLGIGFVALTFTLDAINYLLLDGNPWFWSPSFRTGQAVMQNYIWTESIWSEGKLVPFLWFVVAGSATAMLVLLTRIRHSHAYPKAALLFSAQLLLAASFMAYLQSRGVTLLGHYYYACYLLPFVFLVFGASFWPAAEKMRRRAYIVTCWIATLLFGSLWCKPATHPLDKLLPEWGQLLAAGAILASALLQRQRRSGTFLAITGLAILTSVIYTGSFRLVELHSTRDEYARVMNARQRVEEHRDGAPIVFWYDKKEPDFFEYYALNAGYLAEFSRISQSFPQGCGAPIDPSTIIVVTSIKQHAAELARSALADCWRRFGIRPVIGSAEMVPAGGGGYTMAILRIEAGAYPESPAEDLVKAIPLEQLRLADSKASLENTRDGLEVNTPAGFGAFAARVPLGLDPAAASPLEVHVRMRVFDGKVGLGILDSAGRTFLQEAPVWPLPQMTELILPLPSPPMVGDLVICNRNVSRVPSSILVEKIEIRKMR
jgi:hypothetical protein